MALLPAVQRVVSDLDPGMALIRPRRLEDEFSRSLIAERTMVKFVGGLSAIALSRLGGASAVFAIGAPPSRLDLARRMGADHVFDLDATTAAQRLEESVRRLVRPGYRPTLADNLVHINHFTPSSLRLALERSGFGAVTVSVAAPEMPEAAPARLGRRAVFLAARLPGGTSTPFALNLLAVATRA